MNMTYGAVWWKFSRQSIKDWVRYLRNSQEDSTFLSFQKIMVFKIYNINYLLDLFG